MNRYGLKALALGLVTLFSFNSPTLACTDFRLSAKDGTVFITRSMEYALDLKSNLRSSTRNRSMSSAAPEGKPGLAWKAKYGYVFLDGLNVDVAIDGMNEEGLSFEALYLPEFAKYQEVPAGQNIRALSYLQLGDWILSNFKTIDEVREAISTVYVYAENRPELGTMILPLHYAVYDASGKGLVLEYINGQLKIYDNQIGVMTNSPGYDWHLKNLNNYVRLRPVNPPPVIAEGVKFAATGQGFGMIGLPGDISPPSRFVKIAVLLDVALAAEDAAGTLNLAEHLINNVDIPRGLAREPQSGKYIDETSEWVVFKDLSHKIFYYRTYGDQSLHLISLSQLNFSENAPRLKMPIASKEYVQDLTAQFLKSKG